ncbi:MAG: BrnA antitoxin family protein [Acidobacteriota bacterium]
MSEETKEIANAKVQITMKIDLDVLNYFKERASEPNSAPYQTQINNELRAIMENNGKAKGKSKKAKDEFEDLLSNKKFLKALAKEVKKLG